MLVVAGLASPDKYPAILSVLQNQFWASPYMEKYVLESLYIMGYEDEALTRMKTRYTGMVNSSLTTLWELWSTGGSGTYNHAWAGGPLTLLSQYGAGVSPTSAAWSTYHVLPQEGALTSLSVEVPSVKGDIDVSINKNAAEYTLDLTSPSSTTATVGIPKGSLSIDTVSVNGTTIWDGGTYLGGVSGITFNSEDSNYIKFDATPGTWSFVGAIPPDTTAPSQVTGVSSSAQSDTWVALNWDDATDNIGVDHYLVYRDGVKLAEEPTITNITDSGLTLSTSYNYEVSAVDFAGNEGAKSSVFTLSTTAQPSYLFYDHFDDNSIDAAKWSIIDRGLESNASSGIVEQESNGQLQFSGTTGISHWAGRTAESNSIFSASAANPLTVEVDRISLSGSGTAYRSSLWLWVSSSQYIHFSQNIGESNWQYNIDGGGGTGTTILDNADSGNHSSVTFLSGKKWNRKTTYSNAFKF